MTPREARTQLAADLRAGMAGWTVHAGPQMGPPKPPAIVLAPRPTYLEQGTSCTWEMRLTVTLALAKTAGTDGMDYLDDAAMEAVQVILRSAVLTIVETVSDVQLAQEAGGIEYMTATIQTTSYVT